MEPRGNAQVGMQVELVLRGPSISSAVFTEVLQCMCTSDGDTGSQDGKERRTGKECAIKAQSHHVGGAGLHDASGREYLDLRFESYLFQNPRER